MTHELEKQFFDTFGIEPKQFVKDFKTREKAARFGRKITGIPKYRGNKFDIGSYTDNQSIYQVHWKEFPDFTQSKNLVKLLNLPTETIIKNGQTIPAKNIWWIVNMDAKNCEALASYYFEDLLIHLIVILENKYKIHNDEFVNSIKQAIRETEWKYEN